MPGILAFNGMTAIRTQVLARNTGNVAGKRRLSTCAEPSVQRLFRADLLGSPAVDGCPLAVRRLRPRAVLRGAVRLLRLQHLHGGRAGRARGRRRTAWLEAVRRELALAAERLGPRRRSTPCSSAAAPRRCSALRGWRAVLDAIRATFGLADGAEVTTEANPESTSPEFFAALAGAGYTRVSLGMQSAAPHVLRVLDRRHTPGRAVDAAREARAAGLAHVNLDLIYAHAGGDRRRPRRLARRRASPPGWTTSRRTR